uniref:PAX-interacting protein 1 n=1 Tax=Heterorhabditis bacteriophora TaxID=37862 RepID=A0A1I7XDC1_HETBA
MRRGSPYLKIDELRLVYANAAGPQPQTPQTPQPPFTPNGSRFPQPTPSPHYAADMRSPPLMSPTQAPLPPQATMPRPMSNGDLVAQPMRMTVQPQPVLPSLFCTYEPNFLPNVHPDICLAGCVFHMFEAERSITDKMDLPNIVLAIRMHGGEIEFGVKLYAERAAIITHVIVESIRTPHAHMALKDRKRLVTLQWLWDVLMKKQMDVPWRHAHLPSVFMDGCRPLFGRLISFSGFDEGERAAMKFMLEAMGARMTPYLSRHNNVLIAKTYVQVYLLPMVVNYQWLADHYTGHQRIDNDSQRYQMGQPCDGVGPGPYVLEMVNDQFKQLLAAWKYPVIVASELWRRALETKQTVENDDAMFPNKKLKIQTAPPSDEDIDAREKRRIESGYQVSVIVAFVGIDDDVKEILTKKLRFLGGRVCEDVADCTHLVAPNGRRTERLLEAISLGKNIVNPYWIVHGYECRQWMGTFLSPRCIETDAPYVVISCECDLKMVQYLLECNFRKIYKSSRNFNTTEPLFIFILNLYFAAVYNADFVLISLLRQEMEPHPFYRVNVASIVRPAHHPHPGFRGMPRPIHEQAQPHRVKA